MPAYSVADANPIVLTRRDMRNALLAGASFQVLWPDIRALLLFGVVWLSVGYLLFNFMERRARRTGTIGHY